MSVVTRDSLVMTVLSVPDLEKVVPLTQPALEFGDTTRFRSVVLELLSATCLIGCDARIITSKKDLSDFDRKMAKVNAQGKDWKVERPESDVDSDNRVMKEEFSVATSSGVYGLTVYQIKDVRYTLFVEEIVSTLVPN